MPFPKTAAAAAAAARVFLSRVPTPVLLVLVDAKVVVGVVLVLVAVVAVVVLVLAVPFSRLLLVVVGVLGVLPVLVVELLLLLLLLLEVGGTDSVSSLRVLRWCCCNGKLRDRRFGRGVDPVDPPRCLDDSRPPLLSLNEDEADVALAARDRDDLMALLCEYMGVWKIQQSETKERIYESGESDGNTQS